MNSTESTTHRRGRRTPADARAWRQPDAAALRRAAPRWAVLVVGLALAGAVLAAEPVPTAAEGPSTAASVPGPAAAAPEIGTATAAPGIETAAVAPGIVPAPAPDGDAAATEEPLEAMAADVADPLDQIERQVEAQEYDEAAAWLEQRIAGIEANSHSFDERLVRPLTLLGDARAAQGQYDVALGHYEHALHLNRVNSGLNTPEQVGIVYREANVLKALGQYQEANDREEYAYHVLNRSHEPLDEELLPGIYHLAEWYERTNNVFAARSLYERAVQIIDAHDQLETASAIPALHGIATSYRMERFPPFYLGEFEQSDSSVVPGATRVPITVNNFPAGETALQRIVQIRQKQQPPDRVALAKAVLDLADWYTLFDKPRRAVPLYGHAWELMSQVESFDVASYFAEPEMLYFPDPGDPSPPPVEQRGERATGYVELSFGVTDDGYVRDLDTVTSVPDGLMDFRVRKSLRLSRYRPMLVDGVPVYKDAVVYRHEFPYYPEREGATPATAAMTTDG